MQYSFRGCIFPVVQTSPSITHFADDDRNDNNCTRRVILRHLSYYYTLQFFFLCRYTLYMYVDCRYRKERKNVFRDTIDNFSPARPRANDHLLSCASPSGPSILGGSWLLLLLLLYLL